VKSIELPISERSDRLGRYYTSAGIGRLLVDQMSEIQPNRVLDLGAGSGSLSRAALERWGEIELLTVDIDTRVRTHIQNAFSEARHRHEHIQADALSHNLSARYADKFRSIDAAVCNPPFISPKWRRGFAEIIEAAGFSGSLPVISNVDAALLFLCQNLRLLSAGATLGIILPDTLISSVRYQQFRKILLQQNAVKRVIRLPRGSFQGTDALAHIVIVSKLDSDFTKIPLQSIDNSHRLTQELNIDVDQAIVRMDFEFHDQNQRLRDSGSAKATLGQLCADIKRGLLTSAQAKSAVHPVFHTTDMTQQNRGKWKNLTRFGLGGRKENGDPGRAQPGDILIGRVGRKVEEKIIGVASGYPVLTDCVYRVRVPKVIRSLVLRQLCSAEGKTWLASRMYGVSAQHLSKSDLMSFPIINSRRLKKN
jgi:type I restriction enzyme M protein